MRYVSTRGGAPVAFAAALGRGPAPDGGLYLPESVPPLPEVRHAPAFADTAARTLLPYARAELDAEALEELAGEAFAFEVPLVHVAADTWALELTHGPTGAFKDAGARFLAGALARLAPTAEHAPRTVLVATSGDTGAAVAHAFRGISRTRVLVLYPHERVSALQRRQLTTIGGNVRALAVRGPFDACQRLVRGAFLDEALRVRYGLTSANSLNVGRLLPQIAFYLHAVARLHEQGERRPPTFVVPSGNLGNLTAGVLAARMGLPTTGFVAALNANDAFARALAGDTSAGERATVPTLSNAMDVARPSNLERLRALAGQPDLGTALAIVAFSVEDDATRAAMARLWHEHGYLADPHTAVGFDALERARRAGRAGPAIVLATAHPAKFPEAVRRATGVEPEAPPAFGELATRTEEYDVIEDDRDALAAALALASD